ncbi:MAG: penicillin-binding transpeptidase domain-containing protein [Pseudomonadota bacterium]
MATKAFYVQVINREKLIAYSNAQTLRVSKVYPNRGHIYDRNKSPLAINVQTYSIFTIPRNISKDMNEYKRLAQIVPQLNWEKLRKKVYRRDRYTWLARKVALSDDQVMAVKELPGIYIDAVPKRLYPNHELLSQVLGFVGVDNAGLSGLEYQFNEQLQGEPLVVKYIQDAKGRPVRFEGQQFTTKSGDLILSIDKDLQSVAERALKEAVLEFNGERGGIGVMDAISGEILAMANYPSFDPENVGLSGDGQRKLAFVSDPFEPGSIFKTITIASALENNVVRPDTHYYCERGKFKVGDHWINEAEAEHSYEWLSVSEILQNSSNIGTTKIAFDLNYPRLQKALKDFGIGEKTGIELPAESRGIFNEAVNVSPISLSNISFGQGVAVTGIQMLAAYAAIANGGTHVRPTIVAGKRVEQKRIVSEKTALELTNMLIKVVENGTGVSAQVPPFQIAGKTGTAQRPSSNGGYQGYVASFIGFPVNVNRPFVTLVYVDNPKGKSYYGNIVAAPVFKKVTQYLLYKNKEFNQLAKNNQESLSKIIDSVGTKLSSSRNLGDNIIPNFVGLDKFSASKLSQELKVRISHQGIGIIRSQDPSPGAAVNEQTLVKLYYQPPQYE